MAQKIGVENELDMEVEGAATVEAPKTEEKATTKRDPLAKYKELDADGQVQVDEIVGDVIAKITTDGEINLPMLLGILDKLNAEKKSAKEVEKQHAKERKEEAKQKAIVQKDYAAKIVKEGDLIDYYFSSKKVRVVGIKVEKVTAASARIDINKDTLVIYKGQEMKAGDLPAASGFTLGMKSAPLGKIENLTRNGEKISLEASDEAQEAVA